MYYMLESADTLSPRLNCRDNLVLLYIPVQ
jgi:hypothetical protein